METFALANLTERALRMYLYPITTSGWVSHEAMSGFVDEAIANVSAAPLDNGRSRMTYSAGLLLMRRLLTSRVRTTDAREADLFLVPQWEGLLGDFGAGLQAFRGVQPQLDLVLDSRIYSDSGPTRNHLVIYTSDATLPCDAGVVQGEIRRRALAERFVTLQYSGRVDCFGLCHTKDACCKGCYNSSASVVVPSVIPRRQWHGPTSGKCGSRVTPTSTFRFDLEVRTRFEATTQIERHAVVHFVRQYRVWQQQQLLLPNTTERGVTRSGTETAVAVATLALINTNRSDFRSVFGLHAAGYGTWSARLWDFMTHCVVPVIFTDGVILPFERFLQYELFSAKLLST
eukprot:839352-Prymnesium_polylepis.2